jgi:hypothetical protein
MTHERRYEKLDELVQKYTVLRERSETETGKAVADILCILLADVILEMYAELENVQRDDEI